MFEKGGKTGATHILGVMPTFQRASWSFGLRRPGEKVKIHAHFVGVPDGETASVEIFAFSLAGIVTAKSPPSSEKIKKGRCTFEWTCELEGPGATETAICVLAFVVRLDGTAAVGGTSVNDLVVAKFGAIIQSIDKCFCPGVESLQVKYHIEDPSKFVRSGVFRVYGNKVDGKSFPDKKAIVYQRMLTPSELSAGGHTLQWEGYANAESGAFKPPEKGVVNYVNPLYSPYVVQIQLLDRPHGDPASWPQDDALPSCPSPTGFADLGLKEASGGFLPELPDTKPLHCGFEVVYAGLDLGLGDYIIDPDVAASGNALYQLRLNQLGYFCGPVDDIVGELTKQGIHEFKRTHWEVTGEGPARKIDHTKPLDGHDLLKVKATLDAKTKAAIDFTDQGRTWMRLVDDANQPIVDGENKLPGPDQQARIEIDGTVVYQAGGEFWNSSKGKADITKQEREKDWIPRPWIPLFARPLLKRKNGSKATAEQSRYGVGPARVLFRVVDPKEDHTGLMFPKGPFIGIPYRLHVVKAGETLIQIADAWGFDDEMLIWEDPLNAGLQAADPNGSNLTPGDTIRIPPFPNYQKYVAHKSGQPEGFVNKTVAHYAGTTDGEWIADNAPDKVGSKKNYGIRTKDEKQRGMEPLRHDKKIYRLRPWEPVAEKDTEKGRGKLVAVPMDVYGAGRGIAAVFFVPSINGGDNFRVEAWVDFEKDAKGKKLKTADDLKARYAEDPPKVNTGTMTVWRHMDLAEYIYFKDRKSNLKLQQADWKRFSDLYTCAYMDVKLPPDPDGRALTADEYKKIVAIAYPSIKEKDVIYDPEELYPQKTKPFRAQKNGESASKYRAYINDVISDFHERFAKGANQVLRSRSRTGEIIVDIRRNNTAVALKNSAGNPVAFDWEATYLSTGQAKGILIMDQRDRDKAAYVYAHEMGHSLFLYHWKNTGENNNKDHDNDDDYCVMMYPGTGEVAKIDPEFCGKCLMKLRGWNEKALPGQAPSGTGGSAAKTGEGTEGLEIRQQLLYQDGTTPYANSSYELTLPSGEKIEGTTDAEGWVIQSVGEEGEVRIRLLDESAVDSFDDEEDGDAESDSDDVPEQVLCATLIGADGSTPVGNEPVKISALNETVFTDGSGYFEIVNVDVGEYEIEVLGVTLVVPTVDEPTPGYKLLVPEAE